MKKWRCTICGQTFEGDVPPVPCPVCGAGEEAFEEVAEKAGAITPVPGGVGSVTTTMVIENIIAAGEKQLAKRG